MYRLDDSGDPLIAPHVGEKIEVTGTPGGAIETIRRRCHRASADVESGIVATNRRRIVVV